MGEFHDYIYQGYKYKLYVPSDYTADKETPLLVMLHGCGQDPDDFAAGTNMNNLSEQESFLVLYPNMNHLFNPSDPAGYNPYGCWNWFLDKNQHRAQGHPKLIYEIIEEVKRGYFIDTNKVYAAGLSAGGSLACILGVTYPDVFSAIGICSGLAYDAANVYFLTDPLAEDAKKSMEKGVPDPYACGNNAFHEMKEFKKKMRVIVFHGVCDTTVHPINGQQVITQWAQTNFLVEGGIGHADVTPSLVNAGTINGKSYAQHVYSDGIGEPLLELWMIDKMGHAWSGGSTNGSYTDPDGPKATEIMWSFFTKREETLNEHQIETKISNLEEKTQDQSLELSTVGPLTQAAEHSSGESPSQPAEHSSTNSLAQSTVHSSQKPSTQQSDYSPETPIPLHDKSNSNEKASIDSSSAPELPYVQATVQSQGQASVDTKIHLPIKSLEKTAIKLPDKLEEIPIKSPKKRLFSTLLSKIKKRKDKDASRNP